MLMTSIYLVIALMFLSKSLVLSHFYNKCRKCFKRGTKDNKGTVKLINLKQTDNAMAKNEEDKQKNNSTHDTT